MTRVTRITFFLRLSLLSGLLTVGAATATSSASLYERLGGQPGIEHIATALIDRAAADPHTGRSFKDSNLKRVKEKLAEQLCQLSGGPCTYTGDTMRESHAGHDIREGEFYRMVEMLKDVLNERGVGLRETNELLRLLAPMKRDVVEVAPGPA